MVSARYSTDLKKLTKRPAGLRRGELKTVDDVQNCSERFVRMLARVFGAALYPALMTGVDRLMNWYEAFEDTVDICHLVEYSDLSFGNWASELLEWSRDPHEFPFRPTDLAAARDLKIVPCPLVLNSLNDSWTQSNLEEPILRMQREVVNGLVRAQLRNKGSAVRLAATVEGKSPLRARGGEQQPPVRRAGRAPEGAPRGVVARYSRPGSAVYHATDFAW